MTFRHANFPRLVAPALVGAPALALALSCSHNGDSASEQPDRPLAVIVSGDTHGWIIPCGCTSNQSGGLARRGTYVKRARAAADVILADAGGAPGGTSRYDRVKFEAILHGEVAMGIAAHNLGASEVALGADELRRLRDVTAAPLVSANVRDAAGRPIADALRVITAGGRSVALVGVASPRFATSGVTIGDPRAAVVEALAAGGAPYDAVVVLAYVPAEELETLAAALPEADLVVGGPTPQSIAPRRAGPATMLAAVASKGKFLAHFETPPGSPESWSGRIVEIDASLSDDPDQLAVLERYRHTLEGIDLIPADTGFLPSLSPSSTMDYRVGGTESCRKCHDADSRHWDASKHAQAWTTLVSHFWHVDAYCQQCHTTGYGLPGGFASARRTPERTSVGCESCHGPSHAHAAEPQAHKTTFAAQDQCVRCHDHENSPRFTYEAYWKQIAHGVAVAAAPDASASAKQGEGP